MDDSSVDRMFMAVTFELDKPIVNYINEKNTSVWEDKCV